MKFKTTAIAMAVAGIVAAPVAVQAGADEVYASLRYGLLYEDTGGISDFNIQNMSSRFGMRGETDLGNGLTGFGRYEASVSDSGVGTRHLYTGLKGDWGSILMGQTNQTFYNFAVAAIDIPWWWSTGSVIYNPSRTNHAITYAGGGGAIDFGATLYLEGDPDETAPDAFELGISFGIGDTTLGFGYSSVDEDGAMPTQGTGTDEDVIAVTWSGIPLGSTALAVSYQAQDDDSGIIIHYGFGNAYFQGQFTSLDAADQDIVELTLGYTQSLGRKTTMWYEINNLDADTGNSDDDRFALAATLKYDVI